MIAIKRLQGVALNRTVMRPNDHKDKHNFVQHISQTASPASDNGIVLTQSRAIFIRPEGVLCVNVMFSFELKREKP